MRVIALMNQKGGVGKTTTTVNLGAALAELGKRVCLIDLDPQAHLTINYGVEPDGDHVSLYDVLIDGRSFLEAVHKIENVALLPSSIDLAAAEVELVTVPGRETLLKKKMEAAQHDFDVVLLDCPPSLGLLTINALSVANEVIIPMQPHFLALQGVAKLLETVQLVNQRINPQLKVSGIVLTMYDSQTKLSSEVVAELNGFIQSAAGKPLPWAGAKVFATKIRRNIKLAESPSFGQTILKYDPASNGALDYRNLARELMGLPPLAAPVARPAGRAVASAPAAPVMPPALVAAVKAQAVKKPSAVAPRAVAGAPVGKAPGTVAKAPAAPAASAKPQAAPARPPSARPVPAPARPAPAPARPAQAAPIPKLVLTPPPMTAPPLAASPTPRPAPFPAPRTAPAPQPAPKPPVTVAVNPTIDQTKLAASNASKPAADSSSEQEVA